MKRRSFLLSAGALILVCESRAFGTSFVSPLALAKVITLQVITESYDSRLRTLVDVGAIRQEIVERVRREVSIIGADIIVESGAEFVAPPPSVLLQHVVQVRVRIDLERASEPVESGTILGAVSVVFARQEDQFLDVSPSTAPMTLFITSQSDIQAACRQAVDAQIKESVLVPLGFFHKSLE